MAARFKKRVIPTQMVYPNSVYPDLYDNNKTTTDIQVGAVGGVTSTSFMIGDFTMPVKNVFGDSELVGAKIGVYVNSIETGKTSPGIPGLKAYKVPVNIGNREGGKGTAGSLIVTQGFAQICAYHSHDGTATENFDGHVKTVDEEKEVIQDVIIKKSGPYLSRTDGYNLGRRFGKNRTLLGGIGSAKHFKRYGETVDDVEMYQIKASERNNSSWYSVKENKHWRRFNKERWSDNDIGGGEHSTSTYNIKKQGITKWSTKEMVSRTNTDDDVQRAHTANTFFDGVREATTFITQDETGAVKKATYGDIAFSSSKVKTGGQSLHMHTVYAHRDNVIADVFYPSGKNEEDNVEIAKNQNNQTIFVTKELPLPIHLNSYRSKGSIGSGTVGGKIKPIIPTVELSINIENLAPVLERELTIHEQAGETEALTDHPFRMNRSIVITFGEVKPGSRDTLYSYIKYHAPNSEAAGTGDASPNVSGLGTSAKSFMALGLVNDNGVVSTVHLGRRHYSDHSSVSYTDVTFRLDAARGEVALGDQQHHRPTRTGKKNMDGAWVNLEFQLHPDYSGAFFSVTDPETGDVLGSRSTGENMIRNIKNVTASSTGIWAMNDTTNFPRFMTVWVNNYQAIKGVYDTNVGLYNTGLKYAEGAASEANNDNLIGVLTSREHDSTSILQGATALNSASYLLVGAGDSLRGRAANEATLVAGSTIVEKITDAKTAGADGGYPIIQINSNHAFIAKEPIYFAANKDPDLQVSEPSTMETSLYIDKINLRNFGMVHGNATASSGNKIPSRLKIPKTFQSSPPQYAFGGAGNTDNITEDIADHASYICLGFDEISDFEGAEKMLLMNGFTSAANNTEIFTGDTTAVNSDFNCLRVGYTAMEDYGRQGVVDSYSRALDNINPSQIPNESPTFSNGDGTALASTNRGLLVGDIGVDSAEFSVDSADDMTIHGFTSKGLIRWNFDRRITRMTGLTLSNQSSAGAGTIKVNTLTAGTVTLKVNDYIQVNSANGSEQMRIKSIVDASATPIVLNVDKAQGGTVSVTHALGSTVDLVAMPEKRESIYTSARVLEVLDNTRVVVDSPTLFYFDDNQEYILYIYDDSHSSPTSGYPRTLKVVGKNGNEIEFNGEHGVPKEGKFKYLISPKKYWLMMEIHNFTDSGLVDDPTYTKTSSGKNLDHAAITNSTTTIDLVDGEGATFEVNDVIVIDDEHIQITGVSISGNPLFVEPDVLTVIRGVFGTTAAQHNKFTPIYFAGRRYLPEKNYESAVIISEKGTLGATFNEVLYNDGDNINNWDLDPFVDVDDTSIELKDYGFGEYDKDEQSGGHLGHLNLNIINDVTKYKELDISGVVTVDKVSDNDTFTVLISPDEPTDSFKINVDTEDGTNPVYMTSVYEDELPTVTNFNLKPNEKDPFFIDYTWDCEDSDTWYGFLHVSEENITDQYHGAVLHMPLNDAGNDGEVVSSTANTIGAFDANGDSITGTFGTSLAASLNAQPAYNIEGLAGNTLIFDNNDMLKLGANNNNFLSDVTKEMSVNVHVTNTSGIFTGDKQYILYKGLALENQAFSIHAERIGVTTTGRIVARVYSDGGATGKFVQMVSSSTVQKGIPMNIILTFDANLVTTNVKLFINGKLEDQSGPVLSSHSAAATGNSGWIHKASICSEISPLNIGAKADSVTTTGAEGWNGKIEELAVYNKILYPVEVPSGKFTFTKPLEELTSETLSSSKNYNARLFIKDYHNIRGSSKEDVATSASISHRKAAFNINGVAD